VFTGSDNVWGNGNGTNRETGCVDALYVAQTQNKMLSAWLGRNGQDGNGGAWPLRIGLNDENAYYDGTQVQIGHNTQNQWIASADVVGHELGHGIDDHTPGSISNGNTQEFVADTFGAATEWYANNPADAPDFTVGEEINLVGNGPIRYMYNPSLAGDSNCYSSSTPNQEVHAAAGPGNHWFYLVSQGTGGNGQPSSPTCNSSTVTGLGIQKAITIMYNAMLMKTSSSSYLKYRTWTLTAAKNLTPGDCTAFNTVKAAWDAVSVPAQSADPTCSGGTTPPTTGPTTPPTTPPTGTNLLGNPGFESGTAPWTTTSGVVSTASGSSVPHSGTHFAWLDGYGTTHTDTASQSVAVPAGSHATLSFWLKISTS
jgi:Zn-dependent metalloprotease